MYPSAISFLRCLATELDHLGVDRLTRDICIEEAAQAVGDPNRLELRGLATLLKELGIQQVWNEALDVRRPVVLAELIAPYLDGTALDLLCGDGAVAKAIERLFQRPVIMVERAQNQGLTERHWRRSIVEFDEKATCEMIADTVVLCAVLHHEQDVDALLYHAKQVAKKRLVVVENTVGADTDHGAHLLMDIFFNTCLNETELASPGSHRTVSEWTEMFSTHGSVKHVAALDRVPGVPLRHDVLVVDLGASS